MLERMERLTRLVYRRWKLDLRKSAQEHPDEETLACFLEGKLSEQDAERLKGHLLSCDTCAEQLAFNLKLKEAEAKDVPQELLERAKNLITQEEGASLLEIALILKEKAVEIINTTGDVLFGQELVPAPVLRTRQIKDFKDEVTILKDFKDIRVEAKIENKGQQAFNLTIAVREKGTQKLIKDLRVSLLRDDTELESYLSDSGKVIFEHVLLGKYTVEISSIEEKLASILLDIKA